VTVNNLANKLAKISKKKTLMRSYGQNKRRRETQR